MILSDLLFQSANIENQRQTRRGLETFIQACESDFQTGLIEFFRPNAERYAALMAHGQVVNVYRLDGRLQQIAPETWPASLLPGEQDFIVRALSLTPQTVRLVKILVEQMETGQTLKAENVTLEEQVAQMGNLPQPSLLHFSWKNAEALALLPGAGRPPRHSLFIAADQILHSAGSMVALYGWREPLQQLSGHHFLSESPAWEEYVLHHAFVVTVARLLSRFEELTGRILLNALIREMNYSASAHGWNISLTPTSVTDQAVFSSPQQAAEVYRRMLQIISSHLEISIGTNLLHLLRTESEMRLRSPYRQTFEKYLAVALQKD
ncbi:MAG: hypothetical protein CO094_04715 [Anaerolineae bacterium CG_4_9_14_3_um_filter_57_17]|nr:hypothetical protein [bacterium]NCT19856.1 hypothetical protein [bacterium]OIO83514.1 MAG: hypothetical protein AUK01_12315 [Anaerolineae bacterium CG2_30_57_67]PJB67266.1 MAG: hypothetical protein CO094_04715 [Anaerolineae bacterium CG_4_9_14_3_um_filter_57_17]